jgi:diguanylate cyclase (GGDEF)-like protein
MISVCVVASVVVMLVERNDRLLERLAEEARVDPLTGLLNRRGFDERAALELARAKREGGSLALVTFDIDYFKRVNDEWGHEIGDRVLVWTGGLLAARSRDIDVVGRFGGEEFIVLLPGSDSADAAAFAERVRTALVSADSHGLPKVRLSAGIDSATGPERLDALLKRSDSALYSAKRAGRDQTVIFEENDGCKSGSKAGTGIAASGSHGDWGSASPPEGSKRARSGYVAQGTSLLARAARVPARASEPGDSGT